MVKKPAKKKKSAKKAKAKPTVHVGVDRLEKIKKAVAKARVGKHFKNALSKSKKTVVVQMDRNKFHELKGLIATHGLGPHLEDCDCKKGDPFCICI
jgi:hypothetical protein